MATQNDNFVDLTTPVLIEFAQAVYICQAFESSLCVLLSLMAHDSADGEDGAFRAAWDFHSKKTLGQLVKSLRETIDVPEDLDTFLGVGVDKRNALIHGFFTRNARRLYDPKGRLELQREIVELKLEVKSRDVVVNELIDALLEKYGLSNEKLKRDADRLWDYLNRRDSPDRSSDAH